MRKVFSFIALSSVILTCAVSCGQKKTAKDTEATEVTETVETAEETCFTAIDKYLVEAIGSQYSAGEFCIPYNDFISVKENADGETVVLGDFWVFNFNQAGDTLKTVSGGNHPGKMVVKKGEDGHFTVTSFERVADGADFEPTAKAIFGDDFEDFHAANSNQEFKENARKVAIAEYVKAHKLPVKLYQDYGWPAVELPSTE